MNTTQKKAFPGAGQFDSINSFYTHKIHCTTGKILKGYSKSKYFPEMKDKILLLQKVILRLVNNGYLKSDRTEKIEFYKKDFLGNNDELILTLFPSQFSFNNNENLIMNEDLYNFLDRLYTQMKAGIIETAKLIRIKNVQTSDPFDLTKKRFKSEPELLEYVLTMHKQGNDYGQCFDFYFKFKEKYL